MSILKGAASVLRLFSAERQEVSVTDAARLLGIPKSSASRLLKAMLNEQFLINAPNSSRYRVGHLMFEASRAYLGSSTLMDLVDGEIGPISAQSGHTGYISILDRTDILVLRVHLGTQHLRVVTPLGHRSKAFATATGRTLLARLTEEQVRALPLDSPRSPGSPQTVEDLLLALADVRRRGWEEAIDEEVAGVGSVAVSVADGGSREALAFCLSFPAHTVTHVERRRYASMLVDSARRVAAQVDDPFWTRLRAPRVVAA